MKYTPVQERIERLVAIEVRRAERRERHRVVALAMRAGATRQPFAAQLGITPEGVDRMRKEGERTLSQQKTEETSA